MRYPKFAALISVTLLFVGTAELAAQTSAALGHDGQLQRVIAAPYGDLFAEDEGIDSSIPVLAFETSHPGEEIQRVLVPGTDDLRTEIEPQLFQDPKYNISVLMWRSQPEAGPSFLHFATFDGLEWSPVHVLEEDGVPLAMANAPLIAETRDAFELELEEGMTLHAERRILHLLWQNADEVPTTYYAPLNFVEGHYLGWHGVVALNTTLLLEPTMDGGSGGDETPGDSTEPPTTTVDLSPTLGETLDLQVASDPRSVLVTFANLESQRLGTVEISPLPLELGLLGEQIRDQLWALADLYDPDNPIALSDEMRAAIIIIGLHFNMHEAYSEYVADRVADWITESAGSYGWSGFESLGNDARNLAIDVSNEVFTSTKVDPANPDTEIVEINIAGLLGGLDQPDAAQTIDLMVRSDLPAPAIGEGITTLYTSRRGDRQLVAWESAEGGAAIHWVESQKDGTWSDAYSLTIDDSLTLDEAHRLLAAKVH